MNELDRIIATGGGDSGLQNDIDNAMQTLRDTVAQLKSRRNACSPLLRLPVELMSNILSVLEDISPPSIGYVLTNSPLTTDVTWVGNFGWIRLSHVCKALRTAILQRGDLWARNIYRFSQIQDVILPRCGNHPLALRLDSASVRAEAEDAPMRFVLDNLARAATLVVNENNPSLNAWPMDPSTLSRQPFPSLTSLDIRLILYNDDGRLLALTSDIYDLPPIHAPLLRSLILENYMISFSANSLTRLSLTFSTPVYLHTPRQFLDLLRSGTQMEHLELGNCIPLLGQPRDGEQSASLDMPNLRYLGLDDNIERCLRLWPYFSILPETRVVINLQDVSQSYPAPNSHLAVIPKYFGDWAACSAPGLTVCEHENDPERNPNVRDVSIHLCVPCPGAQLAHWDGGIFEHRYLERRQLMFDAVDCSQSQFNSAVAATHVLTDVSTTTALELDSYQAHDAATWAALLQPYSNVETLYVENPAAENVIAALTTTPDGDTPLLLPRLQCLWLGHLDVVKDGQSSGATRAKTMRMLASRVRSGAALKRFRIDVVEVHGLFSEGQILVTRLQSLVPSFEYKVLRVVQA